MSGLIGGQKADTSAIKAQMAQQQAETEKLRQQAEEEKRNLAEQMAAKRMARGRGGNRLLLAEERLNPEAGVDEQTLGAA
jgi:septal ring factor EnvC (AmiA/AmiB activator)